MTAQAGTKFVVAKSRYDYPRLSIPVEVAQDGQRTAFMKATGGNSVGQILQRIFNGFPYDWAILSQELAGTQFRKARKGFVLSKMSNVLGEDLAEHPAHRFLRYWSTGLD